MTEILCPSCQHFAPALDPNIARAFLGGCKKKEYPFTLILPLPGVTRCDVYQPSAKPAAAVKRERKAAVATAAVAASKRVEFYYSSSHRVGEQFACDVASAKTLLAKLQAKGISVEERDLASITDAFPVYHKAVTGPGAAKRAVFGMKGALEEDFGRRVPALLIFEGDRYPSEVFPRMDRELNRVVTIEEALEGLLAG